MHTWVSVFDLILHISIVLSPARTGFTTWKIYKHGKGDFVQMMCRSSYRSQFPQETVRPRLGTCARRRPSVHAKDTLERRQGSGQNAKTESSACETGTPLGSVFGSHGHGRAATGDKEGKKKTRAPKKRSGSTSRGPVKKIERNRGR